MAQRHIFNKYAFEEIVALLYFMAKVLLKFGKEIKKWGREGGHGFNNQYIFFIIIFDNFLIVFIYLKLNNFILFSHFIFTTVKFIKHFNFNWQVFQLYARNHY